MNELHMLVLVKIRLCPESGHCGCPNYAPGIGATCFTAVMEEDSGAIEGSRTPDLRYHKPAL